MKKFLAAASIALCALSSASYAAVPTTESINTLLQITHTQNLLESVYGSMEQTMRQSMQQMSAGQTLSDEQKRVMDATPKKFAEVMRQEFTWAKLQPIYVNIYQESFTQEEIDGLIAFYRSPAGDALVKKMPLVLQKSMGAMQGMLGPMAEKMKAAMQEAMAEAKIAPASDTKK